MNNETSEAIYAAVMAEVEKLKPYQLELVYVDYSDSLSDEQVDAIVRGDYEHFDGGHFDEWSSDNRFETVCGLLDEILKDLAEEWDEEALEEWKHSEEWEEARFAIEDKDTSEPLKKLAHQTGSVMLRITLKDEDDSYSFKEVNEEDALDELGLPRSEHNLEHMAEIIANASPEFSVAMVSALASVDVGDLYDLLWANDPSVLEITNPGIWMGNPFAGSGYADQLEGTILVKREDLRTDKGAFGYGWQEVSCCHTDAFPVKIRRAT